MDGTYIIFITAKMRMKMKSISRLVAFGVITIATVCIISCKKGDTGPAGPAGPAGPQGAQGVAGAIGPTGQSGNANVMEYFFFPTDSIDLSLPSPNNGIGIGFSLPSDPVDTLDLSAWFIYLYKFPFWYAVPGHGENDASQYSFAFGYIDITTPVDSARFYIDRVSGPGEKYEGLKLIRILTSDVTTDGTGHRRGLPNIDFNNYEAVKEYYHLK
jgi:hypothetical protein